MIKFKYKNNEYSIYFYYCGNFLQIKNLKSKKDRIFKFDKNTTIKDLLDNLDKIQI